MDSLSHGACTTRRDFCALAGGAALQLWPLARAAAAGEPPQAPSGGTATRPDVAAIDRERILSAADGYLSLQPAPVTSLVCPRSPAPAAAYYSEAEPDAGLPRPASAPAPFLAQRDALFTLGLAVPALAAAYTLTREARYADHAATHLRAWFVDSRTRMIPAMDFARTVPVSAHASSNASNAPSGLAGTGSYEGVIEALPLVEIAIALPFLTTLGDSDRAAVRAWFAAYYRWLTEPHDSGPRLAALARDSKSHHGASWMLQACACAYLAAPTGDVGREEDASLTELRHRFKATTLRAQISPDGYFPHEIGTATPYRNSLFNLDMLAAICQLLSTRLESIWDYQLDEGPGMRGAVAWHFPFIADRGHWPYRADADHFDELPGRRVSLLLAARAYQRPEYAALWKTLRPGAVTPAILRTMPVQQPLLWTQQPPAH